MALSRLTSEASAVRPPLVLAREVDRATARLAPVAPGTRSPALTVDLRTRPRRLGDRAAWLDRQVRWLVIGDAGVALVAGLVAMLVRFGVEPGAGSRALYLPVTVIAPAVWVGALTLGRCYERRFLGEGTDEFRHILDSAIRLTATLAIVLFLVNWSLARGYVLIMLPLATVGTLLMHLAGRKLLGRAEASGSATQRVLIIGTERATAEMVRRLRSDGAGFELVGALVDTSRSDVVEGVPVVGSSQQARDLVHELDVDAVAVAAWSTFSPHDLRKLAWDLEGSDVDVLVTPNLTDVSGPRISIRPVGGLPLLHVEKPEFTGARRIVKGIFDRGTALAVLLLTLPLLLLVGLAIRLDSRGPAVFRQTRVGRGGREFSMLKFRSMYSDAEKRRDEVEAQNVHCEGPLFKAHDDPRTTRIGRLLRRTSLDELPQLWNVLRGQMSLVGPRPPLPREVEAYEHDVNRRLLVKPGLTGLWQVSGRADLSWEDSVRLDLYYVENWNLFLDLSILVRTFRAVIAARGAY